MKLELQIILFLRQFLLSCAWVLSSRYGKVSNDVRSCVLALLRGLFIYYSTRMIYRRVIDVKTKPKSIYVLQAYYRMMTEQEEVKIHARISQADREGLCALVELNKFMSISDAVRQAIRNLLKENGV